jgi:uncharacterized protein YyaL (SSP411 family)
MNQDADSLDKAGTKKEGAFYLWTQEEVEEVLGRGSRTADIFKKLYYVKAEGNCDLSPRRFEPWTLPSGCTALRYHITLQH